jgi:hypothetical protein
MIPMFRSIPRLLLLLPLALTATGCADETTPENPTAPTAPTAITEAPLSGTLNRNGAATYPFVANTGTITATLTTLTPDTSIVGFALGEWNATTNSCQLRITSEDATKGKVLVGSAQLSQNYCVRIADSTGQLTGPVAYEITIQHF